MKRLFTLLLCAFALFNTVLAEEYTFDFSSSVPKGWTADSAPRDYEQTGSKRGAQFGKNSNLTLSGAKGISKVVVTCSANIDVNTLEVLVNGNTFGNKVTLAKESNVEKTFSGTAADGNLVIKIGCSKKSVWIKKVVVTCNELTISGDDNNDELGKDLDPNYVYSDVVKVTAPDDKFYNQPCTFIQNNIEVKCTKSTHMDGYFSCAAGESMSITATQPFVAIAINGTVKKGFAATSDAGTIYFAYNDEVEITQNPVLFINDINAKSVTITCEKQIQNKDITIYFKEAPELNLDELFGEASEYTYLYEDQNATLLNPVFNTLGVMSFSYEYSSQESIPFVNMYLENDEQQLLLQFVTELDANTGVAPGTYTFATEYTLGHAVASIGGDAYNDYPSYLMTDIVEKEDGAHYNVYYVVSGEVTVAADPAGVKVDVNAKTYFGSTIQTTYVGPIVDLNAVDAIDSLSADTKANKNGKFLRNGQLLIEHNGRQYNALGVSVR